MPFFSIHCIRAFHIQFTGFHFLNKEKKSIFCCKLQHCIQVYRHFSLISVHSVAHSSFSLFFSKFIIYTHRHLRWAGVRAPKTLLIHFAIYSFRITVGDLIYCSMHSLYLLKHFSRGFVNSMQSYNIFLVLNGTMHQI